MAITLKAAEKIEITILIDNYTDLLLVENTPLIRRPMLSYGQVLLAEHGLSVVIRISGGNKSHTILMDAGSTDTAFYHNADKIGVNPEEIEEIVISHGHFDHIGSLKTLLMHSSCRLPVHLHPAAFINRRKKRPDGTYTTLPSMNRDEISHAGAILNISKEPSLICGGYALLTGEIERTTPYEQGSPVLECEENGRWIQDPFRDDQSLILQCRDHGLIIISGCAHAGIVNTVRYAQKITGIENVHAIMGGFHLSGPYFRKIIPQTVNAIRDVNPDYIIPMHCTGWEAQVAMKQAMPEQFMVNSVGTQYHFGE